MKYIEKNMKNKAVLTIGVLILISGICLILAQGITGNAVGVNADYVTLFPGEQDSISLDIKNNNDFDIEEITVSLVLNIIHSSIIIFSSMVTAILNSFHISSASHTTVLLLSTISSPTLGTGISLYFDNDFTIDFASSRTSS